MLALPACPADDAPEEGAETSTSGDTTAAESTATMTAASGPATSTAGGTTDDSATGTVDNTTGSSSTMGSSSTSTGDYGTSSGSTGAPQTTYPACDPRDEPPCPEGYGSCFDTIPGYNICNVTECETEDDCPLADGGTAEVLCAAFGGGTCVLDCPDGLECPAGMECVFFEAAGVERCLWPVDGA